MKKFLVFSICVVLTTLTACSQSKSGNATTTPSVSAEQKAVETAVMQFIEGADKSDTKILDAVIHEKYRALFNRLFGDAVTTMDKTTYLQMISDKKIGGTPRQTKILAISVKENVASVELTSSSKQADLHSFLHFIKEPDGRWLLVSDMPFAKFKG